MSALGIALVIIGLYLAIKVVGFVFKLAMCALVVFGLYWLAAPHLGWTLPF